MTYDLVIHNGTIVTVNDDFEIIEDGLICIKDTQLQRIATRPAKVPLPDARDCIDAGGGIIMPGLVNTHTHLPMALFRGMADDLPLEVWLNDHIFPAEGRHVFPENVRWGSLLAVAEMLLSGTTTCCDGYFLEDVVAAAVRETGMRAVLGQGVIDFPAPGVPDPAGNILAAAEYARRWLGACPLITPSIFCHSPYTCSEKTLKEAKAISEEIGVLFQIHAAETKKERDQFQEQFKTTPIQYLDRLGILDPHTLLVHCVWLNDRDVETIARRGAGVSHCPESNMKLASGIAPTPKLLASGIPTGLGTDGCASNNNLDLFHEMDIAAKLHKANTLEPTVMDAGTVLEMATRKGAKAIGLDHHIGSLEIGKQADVIVLDTRKPHLVPMYHPESHIVYAAGASDVKAVVIAGKIMVRNRTLLTMDLDRIIAEVNRIATQIRK